MKAGFLTFGCKVNQYETQVLRETLVSAGFDIAEDGDIPDVFVINSCTVTGESDRKSRQAIRKYRALYPGAVLVLTGCVPQANPEAVKGMSEVDIMLGNKDYHLLPGAIASHLETGAGVTVISKHEAGEKYSGAAVTEFFDRTRAYIKIQDGCDSYCSYCIIPAARGHIRSKPLHEIRAEVGRLSEKYSEIVLVGINLTSFGGEEGLSICDAVAAAAEPDGIKRIRLGSMEPDKLTPGVLSRLSEIPKLCPHFHLSLQSGCDETLRRMKRRYTSGEFAEICGNIREIWQDAAITTDIMIGFPGETEKEFEESLDFVKKTGFAQAHIFSYSRRPGTAAYNLPEQIESREKKRRSQLMSAVTEKSAEAFVQRMTGKIYPVLIESEGGGYTPNYTYVKISGGAPRIGEITDVEITGTAGGEALGRRIGSR